MPLHKLNEGDLDKFMNMAKKLGAQKAGLDGVNGQEMMEEGNKLLQQMGLTPEQFAKVWLDPETRSKMSKGKATESDIQSQLLGKNVIQSHSAKAARQRRETGKTAFRYNARNAKIDDVLGAEDEFKELKELEEKIQQFQDLRKKQKEGIKSKAEFQEILGSFKTEIQEMREEMEEDIDKPTRTAAESRQIAERKKGIQAMETFSEEIEHDLNQRNQIAPRLRGSRANRKVRTSVTSSNTTTKPSSNKAKVKRENKKN